MRHMGGQPATPKGTPAKGMKSGVHMRDAANQTDCGPEGYKILYAEVLKKESESMSVQQYRTDWANTNIRAFRDQMLILRSQD